MKIFIVPGYGIPENIFKDKSYKVYFDQISKYISEYILKHPKTKIAVIFSGGKTDLLFPYKKSEAREMFNLFRKKYSTKIKKIKYYLEQKSLSSLENQIYSNDIVSRIKSDRKSVVLFGEKTRLSRIRKTAKLIFPNVIVKCVKLPVNLQVKDKKLVKKKEDVILKYSFWALENNANLKKFRKVFQDKFKYLRRFPKEKQDEAVALWWKNFILKAKQQTEL